MRYIKHLEFELTADADRFGDAEAALAAMQAALNLLPDNGRAACTAMANIAASGPDNRLEMNDPSSPSGVRSVTPEEREAWANWQLCELSAYAAGYKNNESRSKPGGLTIGCVNIAEIPTDTIPTKP